MADRAPIEALWSVVFVAPDSEHEFNIGGGVVVLDTGRLMGGDSGYYYVGDYETNGQQITANIRVRRHADILESVFGGTGDFDLEALGQFSGPKKQFIDLTATIPGTDKALKARFVWLAALP